MTLENVEDRRPSSPKRPWFRFHLLTAMLLMIAAGGFLWANIRSHDAPSELSGTWKGFPFPMFSETHPRLPFGGEGNVILWQHDSYFKVGPIRFAFQDNGWCYGLIAVNVLTGVVGLIGVALVSEYLLRRREGRTP
jgi:hypothetical protein